MKSWILRGALLFLPSIVVAVSCGGGTVSTGAGASTASSSSGATSSGGATSSSSGAGGASSSSGTTSTSSSGNTSTGSSSGASASSSTSSSSGSATQCNPVDPMNDMGACGSGCPAGQTCVGAGVCLLTCDAADQGTCPCDRRCYELVGPDGGQVGAACFLGNSAGERCDQVPGPDGGLVNFLNGGCAQNLLCGRSAGSMKDYCLPTCTTQADCPAHTGCVTFTDSMNNPVGMACAYDTGPSGALEGSACTAATSCITDTLCDATCLPQCDGPGGTCATGTCTAVLEGTATLGYVCM